MWRKNAFEVYYTILYYTCSFKDYEDECNTHSLNVFVMDLISKLWNIQGITLSAFEPMLLTAKEILIFQDDFLA